MFTKRANFGEMRKSWFIIEQERTLTILLAYPNSLFVRAKHNKGAGIIAEAYFFGTFFKAAQYDYYG